MAVKRHQTHFDVTAQNNTDAALLAVEKNLGRVQGAASRMGDTFRAVVGATVAAGLTREMARAAIEAEQAGNRLTAVLKATGGVAGVTRKEIDDLADSLSDATTFDDEGFRNAAASLAKFGNIQGDVFRDGLKLSADLAAFMGTDVPEAAQLLGKALQSPTEGITTLERQFGKLTEAQEENIKSLAAQGRAYEAQQAVLDIVRQKVGGTAQLMNSGLTKATSDVSKAWNELLETAGSAGTVMNQTLAGAASLMKDIKGEMEGVRTPMRGLFEDAIGWLEVLKFAPGPIGMIGVAAEKARLQIDKNRRTVSGRIRDPELEDLAALERSMANVPARPITLGGKTSDDAAAKEVAKRAEELQQARMAAARNEEAIIQKQNEARIRENDRVQQAIQKSVEEGLLAQERAMEERDELERNIKLEKIKKDIDAAKESAERFDDAINTAFDRAVRGGGKMIDVLKNLGMELVNIEIQKRIFAPASKAIGAGLDQFFAGMFSGGGAGARASGATDADRLAGARAGGGSVIGGQSYLVGERGPEIFTPGTGGQITPNGAAGGVSVVQHIRVDARSDIASVMQAMRAAREQALAALEDSLNRGSRRFQPR